MVNALFHSLVFYLENQIIIRSLLGELRFRAKGIHPMIEKIFDMVRKLCRRSDSRDSRHCWSYCLLCQDLNFATIVQKQPQKMGK